MIGAGAMDLQVNLVRSSDGKIVQNWDRPGSAPGAHNRVIWNGSVGGRVPPDGRYAFRVSALGASTAGLRTAPSAPDDESITLYGHVFPVRGRHDFGGANAHFGAGRSGHSHQGQDVFASCGTPLVAARAGKVKFSGLPRRGRLLRRDRRQGHRRRLRLHAPAPARGGAGRRPVYTGQELGEVGDTGNAVGCHLHFEEWSAPGWYDGGRPVDPLPDLKRWDRIELGATR